MKFNSNSILKNNKFCYPNTKSTIECKNAKSESAKQDNFIGQYFYDSNDNNFYIPGNYPEYNSYQKEIINNRFNGINN
jgi:hypothetical protein